MRLNPQFGDTYNWLANL